MAITNVLSIGITNSLVQNTVYALPTRAVFVISNAALEVSNLTNSGFSAVAATTTGTVLSSAFTRCTTGAAVVMCKV